MKEEDFDKMYGMRDVLRRQYIIDRYLKRIDPKAPLNKAQRDHLDAVDKFTLAVVNKQNILDMKEFVELGWIDITDLNKYYSGGSKVKPLKNVLEEIIIKKEYSNPLPEFSKLNLNQGPSNSQGSTGINWENTAAVKKYFDKLEKAESKKINKNLVDLGFSNELGTSKRLMEKLANTKSVPKLDLEYIGKSTEREVPVWARAKNAENWNNKSYLKHQEKFKIQKVKVDYPRKSDNFDKAIDSLKLRKGTLNEKTRKIMELAIAQRPRTKWLSDIELPKVTKVTKKSKGKGKMVISPKSPKSPNSSLSSSSSSRPASYMSITGSPMSSRSSRSISGYSSA